jgi:hypothetical protein
MNQTTANCPDCGIEMRESNDGITRCPYCDSWAFRDAVSDGAIYTAVADVLASGHGWFRVTASGIEHIPLKDVLNQKETADGKA